MMKNEDFGEYEAAVLPVHEHEFPEFPGLIDTGVTRLIESCRAAYPSVGVLAALEAANTAAYHNAPQPKWAADAMTKHVLKTSKADIMLRVKALIRDYDQWDKVFIGQLHGLGSNEKCIENAVELLANEGKAVDFETVRKSYYRVQKILKSSNNQRAVFWISDRILQKYASEFDE